MSMTTKPRIAAPRWLPLLLGFLQAVGPVSIDMYLPAFPAIEKSFGAAAGSAQITLGTWILGLSLGQLIQGALADRFGRRAPLLFGTMLYTVGAVGCALSGSIGEMAAWRFVAAVGGSASMIVPRAVVRDVAEGHAAARMMSQLILVLGAAPILAPSLGGVLLIFADWRWIFWVTAGYGALGCLLAYFLLPDTLAPEDRMRLDIGAMLARYRHILTERVFLTHSLVLSFTSFALFAYLGGSPVAFITHYHLTPGHFAVIFGGVAATYILASQLNMKLIRWLGFDGVLSLTSSLYLGATMVLVLMALSGRVGPVLFGVTLALAQGLTGFIGPTATVGALRHHAGHAGNASAVMGTMQFLIGSTSGFLVGWLTDGTAVPMVLLMVAGAVALKTADLYRPK